MKVIIAGSRTITTLPSVTIAVIASGFDFQMCNDCGGNLYVRGTMCLTCYGTGGKFNLITEVVSGHAQGVDKLGEEWAEYNDRPVKIFQANWNKHGRAAGPLRNIQMADYVGAGGGLIAVWDGESRGTAHMIKVAKANGLKVFVYKPE